MMKRMLKYLQPVFYVMAGVNHFRNPSFYEGLIPPYFAWNAFIIAFSGFLEILLGVGLLFPITRKWAAYGIVLLLIAFIPSHIYFIQIGSCIPNGLCVPAWVGWFRLIFIHPILVIWAWSGRK